MVTENYFNGGVTVDGTPQKGDPKPHQLIAASQLDLGEFFAEEKVVRSIDRMKKMMADNGYYQAVDHLQTEAQSRDQPDGDTFPRGAGRVGARG